MEINPKILDILRDSTRVNLKYAFYLLCDNLHIDLPFCNASLDLCKVLPNIFTKIENKYWYSHFKTFEKITITFRCENWRSSYTDPFKLACTAASTKYCNFRCESYFSYYSSDNTLIMELRTQDITDLKSNITDALLRFYKIFCGHLNVSGTSFFKRINFHIDTIEVTPINVPFSSHTVSAGFI